MTTTHPAELNKGIWTSWLPVTSAWTSQAACNSAAWGRYGIHTDSNYYPYIYDPAYFQSVANSLTCLPPQATSWWKSGMTVAATITSWSIGPIVCPEAYTTFSTSVVSGSSTSVICCPNNYKFVRNLPKNSGIDGVCTSAMTSGQSLVYASPASNSFVSATTTWSDTGFLIAVPVEGYNFAAVTTSFSFSSSSGTSSPSRPSQTSSNLQSPTGSGQSTSSSTAASSVLSIGAKAGIGAGVGAVALIALIGLGFWLLRRKRKYGNAPAEMPTSPGSVYKQGPLVEAYSEPSPQITNRAEVHGNGYSRPVEMQG